MKSTGIVRVCYHRDPYVIIDAYVEVETESRMGHITEFWVVGSGVEQGVKTWDEAKALFHEAIEKEPR